MWFFFFTITAGVSCIAQGLNAFPQHLKLRFNSVRWSRSSELDLLFLPETSLLQIPDSFRGNKNKKKHIIPIKYNLFIFQQYTSLLISNRKLKNSSMFAVHSILLLHLVFYFTPFTILQNKTGKYRMPFLSKNSWYKNLCLAFA